MNNKVDEITTSAQLKNLLKEVDADLSTGDTAPVHVAGLINILVNRADSGKIFDKDCKVLARSIWEKLSNSGLQINQPPLFGEDAVGEVAV